MSSLPRWDLAPLFPGLDSPEFQRAYDDVIARIGALGVRFDALGIGARPQAPLTDADVAAYEELDGTLNGLLRDLQTVRAFLGAHIATDSRDAPAQARASQLRRETVPFSQLLTRHTAWIGSLDVEALIERSSVAAQNLFPLRQTRRAAAHLMSPAEEALTAELTLAAGSAWARLHSDLTSQLAVSLDGADQPMSVIRATATSADRDLRQRAYEAELKAWKTVELPLAAAMNSIKYETGILARRRGWSEPLEAACFFNSIDVATLEAMLSAAEKSFPDFRRYLRAKARLVSGQERLAWFDLLAPVGAGRDWSWDEAQSFVAENFDAYSGRLGDFARRCFREQWIDAEPRPGKRDGAFCMGVRPGESRVLQNYRPSFDGVSTLAHELGHAYHNLCLVDRLPLQASTPMTLAETASIFCQTIINKAALDKVGPDEQLAILEGSVQDSCQVVVDIASRFRFERAVLAKRRERELSADELCELMLQAQRETYGDGLDESCLHPYMWAVKGHYYGSTFYNFPYMFGLLFGLGLYAGYQQDPEAFRSRYDDLLSRTGLADAVTLAADFGLDLRQEAFWTASLDVVRADIDRFVALVG